MATELNQYYFKVVPESVVVSAVTGAGNTITITGTGLALLTSKHRLTIGLSVSADLVLTSSSPELITNTATSIVVDLDAFTLEDVTDVTFTLPNVYEVSFDVNPDITITP